MNKFFVKFAIVLFLVAFSMSACDKDKPDITPEPGIASTATVVMEGHGRGAIEIDGKKQEWTFPARQGTLSKGILVNEAKYYSVMEKDLRGEYGNAYKLIDTIKFVYQNTNYSIIPPLLFGFATKVHILRPTIHTTIHWR